MTIRITEIFYSIQGESGTIGYPTVFVRLTGCPMRCSYCDTAYAFHGGNKMELADIVVEVGKYQVKHVCVTGGEPLAQPECHDLMRTLCDAGYKVSVETGGAIDISQVDKRVYIVLDIKTPASNEEPNNKYGNLDHIKASDCLKFVICDDNDYQWAKDFVDQRGLTEKCDVFFSPSADQLSATQLADWIIRDQLAVRMQVQLHKILWNNEAGR
ncbi:7-carboxy-7-deazaguanine synthase QueE [Arenicella xantha]|uniref:7-carboxy-7-deazaguanine synthase n=1 Tax=Arenicella xantha TaxID=644221 RepID=A0A395JS01_9GAMM|nr:7-carboxy-7-deazaguanine synthase QueE [Arenicella xantha]RBP53216.1 7-carboxy-7-deazaguanine synthase [Arenicella xantha]